MQEPEFDKLSNNKSKYAYLQDIYKASFKDFLYLLGYRDIGRFHAKEIDKLQQQRVLTNQPIRRLWLWSRGFFKTSLITEAHTLWLMVNNPNIRILIVSYSLEVAKKPFAAIRNQFLLNPEFRKIFSDYCPVPNKDGKIEFGTSENLTIPNRTKGLKEPTLMCAGVGTNITGLHFDWMKIDDLVNRDSVTNDTQLQASKDYYSLLRPIFDNPTCPREDVIGTIYHFNDLHANLQKNAEFEQSFIPVAINGEFVFPERISKEGFQTICNDPSMNPHDVQSQYFLNPIDPSQRKFKDEWLEDVYYDDLPEGLSEYLLCDPASTKKATSDFTVIEKWGVDSHNNVYLIDGIRDKLLANERVKAYVSLAKSCQNLKGAKYEVIGGRHGDLENIKDAFIEAKLHVSPTETQSTNASKADRIEQRLTGQFHAKKIKLPRTLRKVYTYNHKSYDFVQELLLEYRQFPFSEHDDILDCTSQLFDGTYIQSGKTQQTEKPKEDEFMWWRRKSIESHKPQLQRFFYGVKGNRKFSIPAQECYR